MVCFLFPFTLRGCNRLSLCRSRHKGHDRKKMLKKPCLTQEMLLHMDIACQKCFKQFSSFLELFPWRLGQASFCAYFCAGQHICAFLYFLQVYEFKYAPV